MDERCRQDLYEREQVRVEDIRKSGGKFLPDARDSEWAQMAGSERAGGDLCRPVSVSHCAIVNCGLGVRSAIGDCAHIGQEALPPPF